MIMNRVVERSVSILKALGDLTRFRIIKLLSETEYSVSDIARELNMTQSAISHQLKVLKDNELVKSERRGKEVFYSLYDDHVEVILEQICNHASHGKYE
ncbi:MAG TPA: winged helix-turn-helix transcriptional regulator [Acholeplasmataceae bacterium]|jgi:DNA-binding transcriptional ArsR family regulator|nr:winged helix-turn-helix transcriptional regulator [Acholeplasmataceae bacterium]